MTLLAASPAVALAPGWDAAVLEPLIRYAQDLAEGDRQDRVWLIDADAAVNVVLRGGMERDLGAGGWRVHGLSTGPVLVPFAETAAAEPEHRAALERAWGGGPPPADGVLDWLASQSAALALAAGRLEPDPARRAAFAAADWSFFGFRRGGVVDMPTLPSRARAQTLKMLRALSRGAPAPEPAGRAALGALWADAARAAHPTQFMLTGEQARAAVLARYPALEAWAAERPSAEAELRWGELLELARAGQAKALDADAARTLAEAGAVLAARSWPSGAEPAPAPGPPAPTLFADVTSTANFARPAADALDGVSFGLSCLDADGDGLPDVFVGGASDRGGALWRNLGGMRFAPWSGFAAVEAGQRSAPADYDGDGWTDLLVLGDDRSATRLFRNRGGTGLEEATREAGLDAPAGIVESALWFDADGDGDLDLYLVYLGRGFDRVVPAPDGSNGSPNRLYLNEGGRFREATAGSGLEDARWGWAAAALDHDGDGREDVYLCNLWGPSRLLRAAGGGRFEDVTARSGAGVDTLCKGVSAGDADGDGRLDLLVSALGRPQGLFRPLGGGPPRALVAAPAFAGGLAGAGEPAGERLLLARGDGRYEEAAATFNARGLGFSWGALLYDLDLDGRQDLYAVNGFYPDVLFYHDEAKVLRLGGPGGFSEPPAGHGADFPGCSRSALAADLDRDGCPDLVVTGLHGTRLLRGLCPAGNRWARLVLEQPGPDRRALGAVVRARAGGREQVLAWGRQGGGQAVSGCGELHVGLGRAERLDEAVVTWPGGTRESFGPFAAGTSAVLRRGAGRSLE